jgi:coproporphyrinogen III oxidase-like Fe-S oxidoreductase
VERIDELTHLRERLLLGLRLDEAVAVGDLETALDRHALARLIDLGLVEHGTNGRGEELRLTRRGRFLGGGVTAQLLST